LKQYHGILIGITAPQQLRYERVVQRGTSLDKITFEQFIFDEQIEGTSSDPSDSNIFACLPLCDQVFVNE
jgi:dephospho-CoA kinase